MEVHKKEKRRGKVRSTNSFVLSYKKDDLTITPVIGCFGGGMKNFKENLKMLFRNE